MVAIRKLTADCTNCCGLCCVAPAFDAEQGFGYTKPAHIPCMNLRGDDGCAIHDRLRAREKIDDLCETGAALADSVRVGDLRREVFSQVRSALTTAQGMQKAASCAEPDLSDSSVPHHCRLGPQ